MIYKVAGHTFSRLKEAVGYGKECEDKLGYNVTIVMFETEESEQLTLGGILFWEKFIRPPSEAVKKAHRDTINSIMSGILF